MYHSRLMAFIDSNQVLYKSQYGFRKQLMSTSLAIIELVEEITIFRVAWGKKPPLRDMSRYVCISCVSEQISVRKHCPVQTPSVTERYSTQD